tara:strand:- start:683 stop:1048 length:366 start_codon:yes stop_codon:yes gene_type:complete
MANPSAEGPSGAGTEVLRRYHKKGQDATATDVITGVANHIYTILSIVAKNRGTGNQTLHIILDPNAAGSGSYLFLYSPLVPEGDSFVMNDKLVITGTDKLVLDASADEFDVLVSYIDQTFA